ncbi:YlbF family regulator [Ammoniphilus sp. CFH 90114]|uniref:YlbF family regulator n=1 Tax=Ammoniphilus sp. CFH 90114 TaxID=2493665 RepID=UPI00100DF521|nr:YlbF family regulator [Ammoniphilus sp. CFH 90114]RXT13633.1 YlbF family regulator [Ammoniphilus sp. CFH 90114]
MIAQELNIVEVLGTAQDIADMIMASEEMKEYLEAKKALAQDQEAQNKMAGFQRLKEDYEEVQRFGKYHPDYDRVNRQVREMRRELKSIATIEAFKKAESILDDLLYHVCRTIADGVSEAIKVPSDNPLYNLGGGGCSTGGCGTGGACGCG